MVASRTVAQQRRQRHHGDTAGAVSAGPATVTVHVPLVFRQRRGRKVLIAPDGTGQVTSAPVPARRPAQREVPPAVRALARAFRWRRLLESGIAATVHEIAVSESINLSYVSRVLRMTLLAPEIVESVLNSRIESGAANLTVSIPMNWLEQDPT